jgi:hypothetical protein
MFLHNSFSHNRLEQNELDLPQAKFGFWVKKIREPRKIFARGAGWGEVLSEPGTLTAGTP